MIPIGIGELYYSCCDMINTCCRIVHNQEQLESKETCCYNDPETKGRKFKKNLETIVLSVLPTHVHEHSIQILYNAVFS